MVLLSELLSISLVLLAVFTALFYYVSHVMRKLAKRHSVCAESIYSLPITYIATFVLLREETYASVAAIYLTVVTVNFSYMKLGRWSTKDWVLRILSIILTLCTFVVYFAFVGLGNVKTAAKGLPIYGEDVELHDLRYYQVYGLFFSSWRFFLINIILLLSIFPQKCSIVQVKISGKFRCSIKLKKLVLLCIKIILIWVILKATRGAPILKSPWGDIDRILLSHNSLLNMTFSMISMLMFFDILSSIAFSEDHQLYDRDEWLASIKLKNENWINKFLNVLQKTMILILKAHLLKKKKTKLTSNL